MGTSSVGEMKNKGVDAKTRTGMRNDRGSDAEKRTHRGIKMDGSMSGMLRFSRRTSFMKTGKRGDDGQMNPKQK